MTELSLEQAQVARIHPGSVIFLPKTEPHSPALEDEVLAMIRTVAGHDRFIVVFVQAGESAHVINIDGLLDDIAAKLRGAAGWQGPRP